jgi:hypothetical protein
MPAAGFSPSCASLGDSSGASSPLSGYASNATSDSQTPFTMSPASTCTRSSYGDYSSGASTDSNRLSRVWLPQHVIIDETSETAVDLSFLN